MGKPAGDSQRKVAVVRGLLGDVDVLPMVVKEGGCGLRSRGSIQGGRDRERMLPLERIQLHTIATT